MIEAGYFTDARQVANEMPPEPQVIFFDAAGTLIYLPRPVGEHYRQVALDFGVSPEAGALDRAFREAWQAAPARSRGEGPRPDDDKGWWRVLVARVFEAVLTRSDWERFNFAAYFEAVYAHFAQPGVWAAFPEVGEVLTSLRTKGHRLGVISNFDRRLRRVLHGLGLAAHFEHIVISSEVGADKPDPLIFTHALDLFGATPGHALHVGDDPRRDGGAAAVGLRVFHLERPRLNLRDVIPA